MSTTEINVTMKAGEAEVVIYDQIGKSFFEDGITAKAFGDKLKSLGRVPVVNVRINSPGGSLPEALGIFNTLKQHGAKVIAHVDGFALSSASIIAMAGDEIRMAEGTWLMLHNPSMPAMGDHAELQAQADLLKRFTESAADIYANRTKATREDVLAMMAAETWMDATEAKAKGFANTITAESRIAAHFDLANFHNAPSMLKELKTMPTVKEIRDACPGCDEKFIVTQLEAGATVQVAMTAWMGEQQKAIATLQARTSAAGVSPLLSAGRGVPSADVYGDAISMFKEAVAEEMKNGKGKAAATAIVCRRDPELRMAYVQAHNAQYRGR